MAAGERAAARVASDVQPGIACVCALAGWAMEWCQIILTTRGPLHPGYVIVPGTEIGFLAKAGINFAIFAGGVSAGKVVGDILGLSVSSLLTPGALGFNRMFGLWPIRRCAEIIEDQVTAWLETLHRDSPDSSPIGPYLCSLTHRLPTDPIRIRDRCYDRSAARSTWRTTSNRVPTEYRILSAILGCKKQLLFKCTTAWDSKQWTAAVSFAEEERDFATMSNDLALGLLSLSWDLSRRLDEAKRHALDWINDLAGEDSALRTDLTYQLEIAIAGEQPVTFLPRGPQQTKAEREKLRTWLAAQPSLPTLTTSNSSPPRV